MHTYIALAKTFLKKAIVTALTLEAKFVLKKYQPKIVAVTGSVGKTSTKDAIYAALAVSGFVRKSDKSFNSDIGVPLTILGLPNAWNDPRAWIRNLFSGLLLCIKKQPYPALLVLEIGADRPGDIRKIASWVKPDVVVVTRLAPVPVHVEFFDSPEAVVREKSELVLALKPEGTVILSADDEQVLSFAKLVPGSGQKVITFGFSRKAGIAASKVSVKYEGRGLHRHPVGMQCAVRYGDTTLDIRTLGSVGKQGLYAVLAAVAVGLSLGVETEKMRQALSAYEGPIGRMRLIEGTNSTILIDDTYNSSPVAVREALDSLKTLDARGRRIAVLGDMLELGQFSVTEHKAIGAYVSGRADILVAVGVRSRDTALGALESGMEATNVMQFEDSLQAGKALGFTLREGDIVLVKGSQGMRMERTVEMLMAHSERAEELLVRQEREWRNR